MIFRTKRNPILKRRIKQIHRELSDVDQSIEAIADAVDDPSGAVEASGMDAVVDAPIPGVERDAYTASRRKVDATVQARGMQLRDERFSEYLSSRFQPARPLKRERSVQRNKAIVMLGVLVVVLYWFIVRFWG